MALIQALDQNNLNEIYRIIENEKFEIDLKDEEERNALHYAAEVCDVETFRKVFYANPALFDATDINGHTPLMNALMAGKIDNANFLAENGADVNHLDNDGHNIIHWATVCGQLEALNWAINKNVDLNIKDLAQQGSAVHYATVTDDISPEVAQAVLITLLQHGANPNAEDRDKRTPILWCGSNGNVEALIALQNSGGDLEAKDQDNLGVLHCAASHGYHEIIETVMSRASRFNVDDPDRAGHSPLFYAVTFGHYESALKLLKFGADANYQDNRLRTPCHCAAAKGQMRMLKLLKQYSASFDIQNYRGDMPFHEAVQSGSKDVVEWLLAMDSSVLDAPNHHGRTGLHLAAASGNIEIVILLCAKKCYVDPLMTIKDEFFTPLDIARIQKHDVVVEYLTKHHEAKSRDDFTQQYLDEWRISFEEMVKKAKLERDAKINARKHRQQISRRPSTSAGEKSMMTEVGVNTSHRNIQSADSKRMKPSISKSTSVTNLEKEEDKESKVKSESFNENDRSEKLDDLDVDEEFENLPPLSEDDTTDSIGSGSGILFDDSDEDPERKVTVQEMNQVSPDSIKNQIDHDTSSKSKITKNRMKKEVRIVAAGEKRRVERDDERKVVKPGTSSTGRLVMRVRREPEIGSDGGDVDIYEEFGPSDNEEASENDRKFSTTIDSRRYIHERAIFQELTHLKRMQIQYGKVQERVLVRSLISNFCKMHGLNVSSFKFQTFYEWEKFLYDALSEQLKIIYLEERDRLTQSHSDYRASTMKLNKFDSRIRRSVPYNDKLRDMQRIYVNSTISSRAGVKHKNFSGSSLKGQHSSKRCDCLEKHLLL